MLTSVSGVPPSDDRTLVHTSADQSADASRIAVLAHLTRNTATGMLYAWLPALWAPACFDSQWELQADGCLVFIF